MKRSEMLGLIWEAINELEDADHILKRIEAAGMLPPYVSEIFIKERYRETFPSGNQWEPEDEKK